MKNSENLKGNIPGLLFWSKDADLQKKRCSKKDVFLAIFESFQSSCLLEYFWLAASKVIWFNYLKIDALHNWLHLNDLNRSVTEVSALDWGFVWSTNNNNYSCCSKKYFENVSANSFKLKAFSLEIYELIDKFFEKHWPEYFYRPDWGQFYDKPAIGSILTK